MSGVALNSEQENLRKIVEENLSKLRADIHGRNRSYEETQKMFAEMGAAAHELHMLLKAQGIEPVHHRHMIKNRGMQPTDKKFYEHIHPAEDLLDFIKDVHANDDPVDQTMDHDFEFNVYTRRWGHEDCYQIKRISTGWHIRAGVYNGDCNKEAKPVLFEVLRHESVNYPKSLPGYFDWLWERAEEDGLTHDEVQNALNDLAEWVSSCEKSSPSGIFDPYK